MSMTESQVTFSQGLNVQPRAGPRLSLTLRLFPSEERQ